jgi:hypothetical protein
MTVYASRLVLNVEASTNHLSHRCRNPTPEGLKLVARRGSIKNSPLLQQLFHRKDRDRYGFASASSRSADLPLRLRADKRELLLMRNLEPDAILRLQRYFFLSRHRPRKSQ